MARPKKTDTPVREKILAVAQDLFYTQGYHQTGTNQLIDEAGVSKASFYSHFPTKEALAVAYVKASAAGAMRMLRERLQNEEDPLKRYLSFQATVAQHLIATDFRGCHFSNIAREFPDIHAPVRVGVNRFEEAYRELLREVVSELHQQAPKRFSKTGLTVDEVTDRYYLLMEGAITASANFHDAWPFQAAEAAIRDLVAA
jgi:AcrR family transcriptional regulator